MVLGLVLSLVIALPLAIGIFARVRSLPRTRRCPSCSQETLRLRSRVNAAVSVALPAHEVHRRWCPACDWSGAVRIPRHAPVSLPGEAPASAPPEPSMGSIAESVDIRDLEVAGSQWRVMVQCWQTRGRWVGRLLFVGPGGRAWMEEDWSIAGRSIPEILSHALTIPEDSLSGRLRRALLY